MTMSAHPVEPGGRPLEPVVRRLGNGLTVCALALPRTTTVAVDLFVRVGSRHERLPADSGLSHLLEHVLFRGCEGFDGAWELNAALERCSLGLGAATYRDFTVFDAVTMPEHLQDLLQLIATMMRAPSFADVDTERRVIAQELADEVDDRGRDVDVDNVGKLGLFPADPLGRKIGGDIKNVRRLDAEDCRRWWTRFYGASNMVLSVAGAVDADDALATAEACFGGLVEGEAADLSPAPQRLDLPALEFVRDTGAQVAVQFSWPLPAPSADDWPALALAHRILDDGTCSRLRHRVVDLEGLAYHVSASLEEFRGTSVLAIEADVTSDNLLALVDAILEVVASLADEAPTDEEWSRARTRYGLELATAWDSPGAMAWWSGLLHLYEPHVSLAGHRARLMAATRQEVTDACRQHLAGDRAQLAVVGDVAPLQVAGLRRRVHRLRRR